MKNSDKISGLLLVGILCAVLSVFGPMLHFLLAGAAILILLECIKTYMYSTARNQQLFDQYEMLIAAVLCFLFGNVSGFYNFFGIISLIRFAVNYNNASKHYIPPLPKNPQERRAQRDARRTARRNARTASFQSASTSQSTSQEGGFYANTETRTSTPHVPPTPNTSKFSQVNDSDIVRQAKAFMQNKAPDLAKATGQPDRTYQRALDLLRHDIQELDVREKSVSSFLDDFFAGSTVSKTRYLSVLSNAKIRLETNYEKARQAVQLFGSSKPTEERTEILNRYVQDSAEIMQKVDRVINELITVQQNDVISDGDVLDSLLDDLADTTSYYQRSSYKNDQNDPGGFTMPG